MKISDAFTGFIEAEDLPENTDIKVTIESVREATKKDIGQDGKTLDKPIVAIKGKSKQWVLNKTNAKAIRRIYGNETDDWSGKEITIFRTTCNAFGKTVACIRVKGEFKTSL